MKIRPSLAFPLALLALLLLAAVLGPYLVAWDPLEMDLSRQFAPPSRAHPLGCDHLGRDLLARLLWGARTSLGGAAAALALTVALGLAVGLAAGYRGGSLDRVLLGLCDIFLTFPAFLLALFLAGVLGTGLLNGILAVALSHWAWYARIVRALAMELRQRDYVAAARLAGSSPLQILARHILPPVLSQLAILSAMAIGPTVIRLSSLSFLGLAVAPPAAEWGLMIADGRQFLWSHPEMMAYPGLMIFLTVWAWGLLGDELRDRLAPALAQEVR